MFRRHRAVDLAVSTNQQVPNKAEAAGSHPSMTPERGWQSFASITISSAHTAHWLIGRPNAFSPLQREKLVHRWGAHFRVS